MNVFHRFSLVLVILLGCVFGASAQETASQDTSKAGETMIMEAAQIEGAVESQPAAIPLQKKIVPLNPLEPNLEALEKPLHPDSDALLTATSPNFRLSRAIMWSTAAAGVGFGSAAWVLHNQDQTNAARQLGYAAGGSLLLSGLIYLIW
ncbi:MAG: hypothetical protein D6675_01535 [Gemmatimonadetes bacterium]|nr:MAG: hypothetical protein D6675_01535 [Gemmatimonadota bacterium]